MKVAERKSNIFASDVCSPSGPAAMRGVQDRTAELFAIADAKCKLRGYAPTPRPRVPKSRFGTMASRIGRALMEVEGRTDRLARLSSKSSLFDDPGAEIAELTSLLKQELASVGASIEALHTSKPSGRQLTPHAETVLQWLQTNFSTGTERFQAALQQREAILNAKESRLAGISGVATAAAPSTPQAPFSGGRAGRSNLLEGARRRRPHNHVVSPELSAVNGGPAGGVLPVAGEVAIDMSALSPPPQQQQQQQQHFWTPRSRQHRDEELTAMKSTLAELGGMFQRFTSVVAEQGETIERIDANTEARRRPHQLAPPVGPHAPSLGVRRRRRLMWRRATRRSSSTERPWRVTAASSSNPSPCSSSSSCSLAQ